MDYVPSDNDIAEGLRIAGELIDAGIPVFAADPCPVGCPIPGHAREEFHRPPKWQLTYPSRVWLDRWKPGMALAAVGGHVADFLDEDPRSGGDKSIAELMASGDMPRIFGIAETPSGGKHYIISPLGEREANMVMPGLDYQGGAPDGEGRAYVWIAPTVKRSKDPATLGELRPYRWIDVPDLGALKDFAGSDDSGHGFVARLHASRERRAPGARSAAQSPHADAREQDQLFVQPSQIRAASGAFGSPGERSFTRSQAEDYIRPALLDLRAARIGEIEETANRAAVMLAHFVPAFWDADTAYGLLTDALSYTAYDPNGPSGWTADKFRPVLDGRRPSADGWKATVRPDGAPSWRVLSGDTPEPAGPPSDDAVAALLAEMKSPADMVAAKPPPYLIHTMLTMDSIAWIIGAPGSKKSFVALDMAACVVTGRPWQGMKVRQGRVVIIAAEGAGGLGLRLRAWQDRYGDIGEGMFVLPRPVQSADRASWAVLVEACRRIGPALVIADTQARVTVGLEENSASEINVYIDAVDAIRQATGGCVLSIHHTGRAGGDARGSSAIDGAQGTELKTVVDGMTGVLKTEKQKDMAEREDVPLRFESVSLGVDDENDPLSSLVLLPPADAFTAASGAVDTLEDWEALHGKVQVQIFKVLRDQGRSAGLTQAEAKRSVVDRWYGGETGRTRGLRSSTWQTAWSSAKERMTAAGDPIVVNVSGERWALDEVSFAKLNGELNAVLPPSV
jgi:hypothetical protein